MSHPISEGTHLVHAAQQPGIQPQALQQPAGMQPQGDRRDLLALQKLDQFGEVRCDAQSLQALVLKDTAAQVAQALQGR